jgi:MFS family permease
MDFSFVTVLGPVLVEEFGISGTTLGSLVAGLLLLRAIADLPIATLSDRFGSGWRRRTLWAPIIVFYALVSTLTAIRGLSSTVWSFFALRAAVNVGAVACETIGVTATSEWWAKSQRGFAVGLHHTGFPIGTFIAGQLVALVLSVFGNDSWRYVFWFSLLSLPFVALYWWLSRPQNFDEVYRRIDENGLETPQAGEESVRATVPWWHVLKSKEVALAAVYGALFIAVFFMFSIAFPAYLAFVGGFSFAQVASYAVVWALTGALFQVLLPSLSDYVGRKPVLVAAGLYAGVILLLLPYATGAFMVFAVQLLYGVVLNAVYPICYSVCADAAPPGRTATAISISTTLLFFGAAAAAFFTGSLIDLGGGFESRSGYLTVFYTMSALSFAAGIMYLFASETAGVRHRRREPHPEETRATPIP